jgi:nucleotide-binding universal stress UspA family protein
MAVLVPFDDSAPARAALELALKDSPDDEVLVLHVVDPVRALVSHGASDLDEAMDAAQAEANRLLDEAAAIAESRGVAADTEVAFGDPAPTIVEYAELTAVERVVIGSHSRSGVARALLGSVAERVVRRSPVPVTVAR